MILFLGLLALGFGFLVATLMLLAGVALLLAGLIELGVQLLTGWQNRAAVRRPADRIEFRMPTEREIEDSAAGLAAMLAGPRPITMRNDPPSRETIRNN